MESTLENCETGIGVSGTSAKIVSNEITNCETGILLGSGSTDHEIAHNNVNFTGQSGIRLYNSLNSSIHHNRVFDGNVGIRIDRGWWHPEIPDGYHPDDNRIGPGNLIGGHSDFGIILKSDGTTIFGNTLGIQDDEVTPRPNGGGILVTHRYASDYSGQVVPARADVIGENLLDEGAPNLIAFNYGNGVVVTEGSSVVIRKNSISQNGGLGIAYDGDPYPPTLLADRDAGTISGNVAVPDGSLIDLYADPEDEGHTHFATVALTDCAFEWSGDIPEGNVTATVTTLSDGVTSAFGPLLDLQVIDVNDERFRRSGSSVGHPITSDRDVLAIGGREVEGFSADGVTPVLLRFLNHSEVLGEIEISVKDDRGQDGATSVGTLCPIPSGSVGCSNPLTVPLEPVDGMGSVALALLTAPMDFDRDSADYLRGERSLTVSARALGDGVPDCPVLERKIQLVRVPVVLLHGLWGDATTWTWDLMGNPNFLVYAGDYSGTNADPFSVNIPKVRAAAEIVNMIRRNLGSVAVACTQVDMIGHSMGGVLAKLHAQDRTGSYLREDNLWKGDFHKLITANSPHFGSKLAPRLITSDNRPTRLGMVFPYVTAVFEGDKYCVDCGAVRDLRPDSEALCGETQTPAVVPMSHAMYSGDPSLARVAKLNILALLTLNLPLCLIFDEDHDTIVGVASQRGGLQGSSLSFFEGEYHERATKRWDYSQRALELLVAPVNGNEFSLGFPPYTCAGSAITELGDEISLGQDDPVSGLTITAPTSGSTVVAGETIDAVVEPEGTFLPERVVVVSRDVAVELEHEPWVFSIPVSIDASATLLIRAFALDAQSIFASSQEVSVSVEIPSDLMSLTVVPATVGLTTYAPETGVRVVGAFRDGVARDITSSALGTTYVVDNEDVAVVSGNGRITAVGPGECTLRVTNGSVEAMPVRVIVTSVPFDVDGSGNIDLADFASFARCFSGAAPTDLPPLECRDYFDLDGDLDIDLSDFDGLWSAMGQ
jgi:pimeloyl-ACP methyl ester carboxylesterase